MIFDGPTAGLDHRIIQAARELFGPAECSHLIDLSSQAACVLQQSYTANSFLFFERLYTAKSTSFFFFWFEKNTEEIGNGLDLLAAGAPMCVGRGDGDPWMHGSRSLTWALIQGGPRVSAAGCFYFHFHFYFPFHVYPQSLAGLFRKKNVSWSCAQFCSNTMVATEFPCLSFLRKKPLRSVKFCQAWKIKKMHERRQRRLLAKSEQNLSD